MCWKKRRTVTVVHPLCWVSRYVIRLVDAGATNRLNVPLVVLQGLMQWEASFSSCYQRDDVFTCVCFNIIISISGSEWFFGSWWRRKKSGTLGWPVSLIECNLFLFFSHFYFSKHIWQQNRRKMMKNKTVWMIVKQFNNFSCYSGGHKSRVISNALLYTVNNIVTTHVWYITF